MLNTMTPTELRALDLEMAEKVMGWKRVDKFYLDLEDDEFSVGDPSGIINHMGDDWFPTESPADAMMVLKKVAENGRKVVIECIGDTFYVAEQMDDYVELEQSAPTLELAICLFAKEVM